MIIHCIRINYAPIKSCPSLFFFLLFFRHFSYLSRVHRNTVRVTIIRLYKICKNSNLFSHGSQSRQLALNDTGPTTSIRNPPLFLRYFLNVGTLKKEKKGFTPWQVTPDVPALLISTRVFLIVCGILPAKIGWKVIGAKDFWPSFNKTRVKQSSVQPLSKKELNGLENA